jgi:gamma-glutamylcyclotransferase (GGCT)/AIG2-like uncharacterized protein YtfP
MSTVGIFTYGSLMFDAVWQAVVKGEYQGAKATVQGYARHAIAEVSYPAAIPDAQAFIEGRLYWPTQAQLERGLQHDMAALDHFEDTDYERQLVQVQLLEALPLWPVGSELSAYIYVFQQPARVLDTPWDVQWFATEGIHQFMRSYVSRRAI